MPAREEELTGVTAAKASARVVAAARQPKKRGSYLRHLLLARSEWFEQRVLEEAAQNGYGFVTPAMHRMFAHLGRQAVSLSELARRLAVTRQALHQTATEALALGLVEMIDCDSDRRLKLVRFSDKGLRMSATAAHVLERLEDELAQRIGPKDLATLRRILQKDW